MMSVPPPGGNQRQPAHLGRLLGLGGSAREQQAQVGADVGGAVDAHARCFEPQRATGVGAGDDDEIGIALVMLLA